jgi:hypothetical protein
VVKIILLGAFANLQMIEYFQFSGRRVCNTGQPFEIAVTAKIGRIHQGLKPPENCLQLFNILQKVSYKT